ncbi:tyrosine-type recombinase/integrase [Mycolicibacterium sp. jd]|uniref:tyrosine-type recombinase/integrase n=1 Tax=unclassified Mycolicibacterium TaxID=2636767 RepID=UPI00351BDCF0
MAADDREGARGIARAVPRLGAVQRRYGETPPWVVVDEDGIPVPEVSAYLCEGVARGFSAATLRSYAGAILRFLRFQWAAGKSWDEVTRTDVRDFVLWMRAAGKGRTRRATAPPPGSVNSRTGKQYLDDHYAPSTINHNLSVVAGFYDFLIRLDKGPVRNPVPAAAASSAQRANAHHNPMDDFVFQRRADYRQKVPRPLPRAIPDALFEEVFSAMRSHRDRAILAFYISTAARPDELLRVTQSCVDYGEQLIAVVRKGTRALQWLPASPDAFVWLRLYQDSLPTDLLGPDMPLWWTLRRPQRRVNYEAMRAVLRRANTTLGTNWTLHDFRHTAAARMAADPLMPLVDIQFLLGHASLVTTQRYLHLRLDQVVEHVREHQRRLAQPKQIPPASTIVYDSADMLELFGRSKADQ